MLLIFQCTAYLVLVVSQYHCHAPSFVIKLSEIVEFNHDRLVFSSFALNEMKCIEFLLLQIQILFKKPLSFLTK